MKKESVFEIMNHEMMYAHWGAKGWMKKREADAADIRHHSIVDDGNNGEEAQQQRIKRAET